MRGLFQRAKDETRTRDPDLGKVMLYQLSYFRISATVVVCQRCKDKNFFIFASVQMKKKSLL
jgi:hypothetical protein